MWKSSRSSRKKWSRSSSNVDDEGGVTEAWEEDDGLDIRDERANNFSGEVGGDGIKDSNVGDDEIRNEFENGKGKKYWWETETGDEVDLHFESGFNLNSVASIEPMLSATINMTSMRHPDPSKKSPCDPSLSFSLRDAAGFYAFLTGIEEMENFIYDAITKLLKNMDEMVGEARKAISGGLHMILTDIANMRNCANEVL
ncbi:hypothetical protein Scep_004430 [Stephania cephalantha]|uniref:Uncharacterized protein n=1 Tax=Stephania cephalantha TaxID=152367 RepID=A0AAP0PZ35_9MAGN